MKLKTVFIFFILLSSILTFGQKSNCKEIDAKIEVKHQTLNSSGSIKIVFGEKGSFRIQMLDASGNLKTVQKNVTVDLVKGAYDIIITDQERSDRCPFYQKIKIEAQ